MACHNEIPKKDISQIGTSRYIYVPTVDLFSLEFWYNIYSAISEIIFIGAPSSILMLELAFYVKTAVGIRKLCMTILLC